MEEYNKYKDYPIGTIVNTNYGKALVAKGDGNCGNHKCIFYTPNNRAIDCNKKCVSFFRRDKQCIYFKPIKEENMEERAIKISLEKAKEWYNSGDDTLKDLALQAFNMNELEEPKLPKSWEEYITLECEGNNYIKVIATFSRLIKLRDVYRQGWKPDWEDNSSEKWVIRFEGGKFYTSSHYTNSRIFSFPTRKLAEQFLENFKDELEELIYLL